MDFVARFLQLFLNNLLPMFLLIGTGALLLVTSLVLTLRTHRALFETEDDLGLESHRSKTVQRPRSAEARA